MPVYIMPSNLIIDKQAVSAKYTGGLAQFRIDYDIPLSEINQEDDELFSLGQMNSDEFDIDRLVSHGLSFDAEAQYSDDFTIKNRYEDHFWKVNWLEHDGLFAWHINTHIKNVEQVHKINIMTMDAISEEMEKGNIINNPAKWADDKFNKK